MMVIYFQYIVNPKIVSTGDAQNIRIPVVHVVKRIVRIKEVKLQMNQVNIITCRNLV
ncbi:Protein of unknown function [Cotesia congregata]|uniref:Uncharacterized protein n=1 Tax=Cotesia congregata TaxID=51543 RepID=A0A8J2MU18_COTCN|nr:Protein of unknown function [Cotesia congregata]